MKTVLVINSMVSNLFMSAAYSWLCLVLPSLRLC